ncbi:MAG: hypothetical protein ABSA65_14885 [Acidimicrobiales bacterium]
MQRRRLIQGVRPPGPSKGWQLSAVWPAPDDATPEVVGVFWAQHETGWRVTGELARQDGRLIVRSFSVQPVRLAWKAALEAIAGSRGGAPGAGPGGDDDVTSAETPRGGVTAELLRSIPFGELLANVLAEVAGWEKTLANQRDDGSKPEPWELNRRAVRQAREIGGLEYRAGRRPYGDSFYRRIAELCLAIQAESPGDGVIHTLADQEGVAYETARTWVARARKQGFLAPGSPGRSGFEAGPRFHEKGERS